MQYVKFALLFILTSLLSLTVIAQTKPIRRIVEVNGVPSYQTDFEEPFKPFPAGGTSSSVAAGNQFSMATLRNQNASLIPLLPEFVYITDASRYGVFRYDAADNTTSDDGAMTLVVGTKRYKRVYEAVTPAMFGATNNGLTDDDTPAIQAAATYAAKNGAVFNPHPEGCTYRVTATINIGARIVSNYIKLYQNDEITPAEGDTLLLNSALTSNKSQYRQIALVGSPSGYIVADFTPATPTPVIAYNLWYCPGSGRIENLNVIGVGSYANGRYAQPDIGTNVTPVTNNLIGLFHMSGLKKINNVFFSSLGMGYISYRAYWTDIANVHTERCGRGMNAIENSASTLRNLEFVSGNVGLIASGAATVVTGIHTEQVREDLIIPSCDVMTVSSAYLEDTDTQAGAGYYAVRVGKTAGAGSAYLLTLNDIRVGSVRPSKKAFRIWSTLLTVTSCRAYSHGVDVDGYSYGFQSGCDFAIPTNFTRVDAYNFHSQNAQITGGAISGLTGLQSNAGLTIPAGQRIKLNGPGDDNSAVYRETLQGNTVVSGGGHVALVGGGSTRLITTPTGVSVTGGLTVSGVDIAAGLNAHTSQLAGLGTMSSQNASNVNVTGGQIGNVQLTNAYHNGLMNLFGPVNSSNGYRLYESNSSTVALFSGSFGNDGLAGIGTVSANDFTIRTANQTRIRVSSSGTVGIRYASGAANPTASDLPDGYCTYWKNTTSGEVRQWCNDGGTLIRSAVMNATN